MRILVLDWDRGRKNMLAGYVILGVLTELDFLVSPNRLAEQHVGATFRGASAACNRPR